MTRSFTIGALAFVPVVLVVLGAAGCAVQRDRGMDALDRDDRFAVLATLPAEGSIAGTTLYPLVAEERVYERLPGGDGKTGTTSTHRAKATSSFDAAVAVALGDARLEFHGRDGKDRIVMPAAVDRGQRALTLFEPPLAIAPVMLAAGGEFRAESGMRVVDAGDPDRQKESGRAVRTITYVDDQMIRTPRGEVRAKRVEIRFDADLRMADASTRTTLWVVPDLGVVASEREETITVLGIPGSPKRERLVLTSPPASPPGP